MHNPIVYLLLAVLLLAYVVYSFHDLIKVLRLGIPRGKRLSKYFKELLKNGPDVISKCLVCVDGNSLGGVAALSNRQLTVIDADGNRFELSLDEIQVSKAKLNFKRWVMAGHKLFQIEMPSGEKLILGIPKDLISKKYHIWMDVFAVNT